VRREREKIANDAIACCLWQLDEKLEPRLAAIERRNDDAQKLYGMMVENFLRTGTAIKLPKVKGTFSHGGCYAALDICVKDGAAWIARRDDPGVPGDGDGWQLLSMRGQRGVAGGERGPPGLSAMVPRLSEWQINAASFTAIPRCSDGSCGPEMDLRPFFAQFQADTT